MINEMLYKSDSKSAVEMMHEDPSMYEQVAISIALGSTAMLRVRSITQVSDTKSSHGQRTLSSNTLPNSKSTLHELSSQTWVVEMLLLQSGSYPKD
jgi:hypothetical protein